MTAVLEAITRRTVLCWLACGLWASLPQPGSAEADERPNILFAISDDQSWMHCGAYGDPSIKTPSFDRVAQEGVLFRYAYCAAPSCAPSRSAILTGRPIWQLEEGGNLFGILKSKFAVFPILLAEAGYEVAATGKTWGPGRMEGFARPVFGKTFNRRKLDQRRPGINPIDYAANFEDFLEGRDPERPFFFWFGATEPHQNYDIDAWKASGKKLEDARLPGCLPDDPVTRGEILDYGLEIEHFDRHLARMIKAMDAAGLLENTLIVVTSDHGNPLPRSKCNLYDSGTRVPLAIRWPPRIPGGREIEDFVSLIDLAPTILQLAGLKPPAEMCGRGLGDMLTSDKSGILQSERDFVVTAFERHIIARRDGVGYPMRSIRTRRYAYIRNFEPARWPAGDPDFNSSHQGFYGDCDLGSSKAFMTKNADRSGVRSYFLRAFGRRPAEELYDMQKDAAQLHNLASDAHHAEIKKDLARRLEAYLIENDDPRMRGEAPWDTYPFVDKRIFANPLWRSEGKASPPPR